MPKRQPTAEVKRHWSRVADIGCIVSRSRDRVTIHHCHGGSMRDAGVSRVFGRKNSDWLVIPLTADLHVGNNGIDQMGHTVRSWEEKYGRQDDHLDEVCRRLGVNVWKKAGVNRTVKGLDE